ncbi:MAG TPA: hypothetical protein ENN39_08780 [Desulfonatronum sp.]|nr:hypothetical protein [Desulfonatronum sp.]
MQRIPLNLAKPGMALAKPILRDNGLVLVAENTELSESLLERLARMEIETITVQGNPVDLGDGGEGVHAQRLGRLEHLFRRHGQDPWMQKVRGHLQQYFQLKVAAAGPDQASPDAAASPGGQA